MTSAVLITPLNLKPSADKVGESMGWGPENYTLPLSDDGGDTLTHYACRTDVTEGFIEMLANPPEIPGVALVLSFLIVDLSETLWGKEHLDAALESNNLTYYVG